MPVDVCLGIDVGTGSVRCAAFDMTGKQHGEAFTSPIRISSPAPQFYQQSTIDIMTNIESVIKLTIANESINVTGIGFAATCSLVFLDDNFEGVSVHPTDEYSDEDIIVWMDHRAENETSELNKLKAKAHQFVGGRFSPEMELPKLKWVKENLPKTWKKTRNVYDLADFLSFKATSVKARSVCTLVCKWGWLAEMNDWEEALLRDFCLDDLKSKTEGVVKLPGEKIGQICAEFSLATGLTQEVSVSASLIDAHSGALGVLQASFHSSAATRLALIAGTSNCHMMLIPECKFVRGVWGPYESAIVSGEFLLEGGQTSAGSTIDWLLNLTKSSFENLQSKAQNLSPLTDVLCIPDFHGNRSPLANPLIKGSLHHIAIHTTAEELFLSVIQGLALGTRMIIERIESEACIIIDELVLTGGLARSKVRLVFE